jgi:uroporphyrinogen-III synthase
MPPLDGRLVGLLESRKADDLQKLVARLGGTPVCAASVREVPRQDDFVPSLQRLIVGRFDYVVILTAAACDALFGEADRLGLLDDVVAALRRTTVVCRGPKPLVPLRRRGLVPDVVTPKPHTTDDLVGAMVGRAVAGTRMLLLHYGERSSGFPEAMRARGAEVEDLCLYEWALPQDLEPLRALIHRAIAGEVDAMLFTSQVQFRHLLQVAGSMQLEERLTRALRDRVIVGAIGPVCARALRGAGIVPDVLPPLPNGPSLVQALADYFSMFDSPPEVPS